MSDYYEELMQHFQENLSCELLPLTEEDKGNRVMKMELAGPTSKVNIQFTVETGEDNE